ncbi:MAG: hypothetical protein RLZZ77_2261 [Bacteroidota bacterium]|jgi:hypothetical protein
MKKISFYLILLTSISLLTACNRDPIYSIEGINVSYVTTVYGGATINNSSTQQWENFGIRCQFDIKDITLPEDGIEFGYTFSHSRNEVKCTDPIKKIFITADVDFDDDHPAGSLLNELFYYRPQKFAECENLNSNGDAPVFSAETNYSYPDEFFPRNADFILTKAPSAPKVITFQIRAVTANGRELIDIANQPITLE